MRKRSASQPFLSWRDVMKQKKWAVGLLILGMTVIWGYAWVLMKESLHYMGPFTFSALRFGVGSVTLLLIIMIRRMAMPEHGLWKHFMIVGLLQTTFVFLLVMYGLRFVEAGKSSVILYSMPIWSSLLAAKFLHENVTKMKGLGLGLGLCGLLSILGWDIWMNQNAATIFGECLIVLAAISWALSNVYYQKKLTDTNKLQVSAYQMLFGTIGMIAAAILMESGNSVIITPISVYYILFTGVLASALCFTIWFFLLTIIDTVTATISTLLVPVFGLFFGWLFLGEKLTPDVIIGSVLILVGIVTAQLPERQASGRVK